MKGVDGTGGWDWSVKWGGGGVLVFSTHHAVITHNKLLL